MRRVRTAIPVLLLALGLSLPLFGSAQSGVDEGAVGEDLPGGDTRAAPEPALESAPAPAIGLDRLLRPRGGMPAPPPPRSYGDRSQKKWEEAFERARLEVEVLDLRIPVTQQKLRDASGGEWAFTPTGGDAVDPEVMRLRTLLRRDRQSLEAARKRLRDLDVEASLAGIPRSWRTPEQDP